MERGFKSWAEKEAVAVRRRMGLGPRDRLPARLLLKELGAVVTRPDLIPGMRASDVAQLIEVDPGAWSAATASFNGTAVVILNDTHSAARQESDLHHEASHLLRGHEPCRLTRVGDVTFRVYDEDAEKEAAWFGGCLQLPRPALLSAVRLGETDDTIGARYVASAEMVRYRRSATGVERQVRAGQRPR